MKSPGKSRWPGVVGCFLATFLLAGTGAAYVLSYANERGQISKGIANGRHIITALRNYASDHDGWYPDAFLTNPQSSNEVFRVLLKENIVDSEMTFGSYVSPYYPDGDIGTAPDFTKALEAGENHWAMTAGLGESAPGDIPVIYENPAVASWPPKWNSRAAGKSVPGRTWSWGEGPIVGRNDSSVCVEPLESGESTAAGLAKREDGKDLFERAPKGVVLDVLKKAE
jgi:hypothetical protein